MRIHRKMKGRGRQQFFLSSRPLASVFLIALGFLCIAYLLSGLSIAGAINETPKSLSLTHKSFLRAHAFNENNSARSAKHLVIVAGHSVTVSGHLHDADHDEEDWYLLDYQKHQGLPQAIVAHITAGIETVASDPHGLLIFSGGETRASTGPDTEGASYFRVADAQNLWQLAVNSTGRDTFPRSRTASEDFARDSFENFLFSICRFYEVTGRYPESISVVSFTFKRHRFEEMHRIALRWPASKFKYIGIDPPTSTGFDLERSTTGELENAAKPFEYDPYGCHSDVLQEKRRERNPFSRTPPYTLSCPSMKALLEHCGPGLIDPSLVPWS